MARRAWLRSILWILQQSSQCSLAGEMPCISQSVCVWEAPSTMCPYGVLLCMARQHAVVWKRMPLHVQVIFEQRCCTLKHQRCEEGGCKWILNNTPRTRHAWVWHVKLTARCACSDLFEDYVGQLQMATIASIQVEHGSNTEMSRRDVTDKLRPLQQVRLPNSHCHRMPCMLAR